MFVVSRVNKSRDFNVTRPHPGYVACRHFQTVRAKVTHAESLLIVLL